MSARGLDYHMRCESEESRAGLIKHKVKEETVQDWSLESDEECASETGLQSGIKNEANVEEIEQQGTFGASISSQIKVEASEEIAKAPQANAARQASIHWSQMKDEANEVEEAAQGTVPTHPYMGIHCTQIKNEPNEGVEEAAQETVTTHLAASICCNQIKEEFEEASQGTVLKHAAASIPFTQIKDESYEIKEALRATSVTYVAPNIHCDQIKDEVKEIVEEQEFIANQDLTELREKNGKIMVEENPLNIPGCGKKLHQCPYCSYATNFQKNLVRHVTVHYKCYVCSYKTNIEIRFKLHICKNQKGPYNCAVCSYTSIYRYPYLDHARCHIEKELEKTRPCKKKHNPLSHDSTDTDIRLKAKNDSSKTLYVCAHCSYTSTSRKIYNAHVKRHVDKKPYRLAHNDFTTPQETSLRNRKRKHIGDEIYECAQCSFTSISNRGIKSHLKAHAIDKPYKCDHCSLAFSNKGNLRSHEKRHTSNDKPYKCAHCSFATSNRGSLRGHESTHSGKSYKCAHCTFTSSNKSSLGAHERRHTVDKPYKNSHCSYNTNNNKQITRIDGIQKQKGTILQENKHGCRYGNTTIQKRELGIHERTQDTITQNEQYKCTQRVYTNTKKSGLKLHENIRDPITKER